MKPRCLAFGGLGLWLTFGGPADDLAGLFWAERPAPWEKVDAFYYPDRHDLSVHRTARDVKSLDGCRSWVRAMAEVGAPAWSGATMNAASANSGRWGT